MFGIKQDKVCNCVITESNAEWAVDIHVPYWYHRTCNKVGHPMISKLYTNKLTIFPWPECDMCDTLYVVLKTDTSSICFFCKDLVDD